MRQKWIGLAVGLAAMLGLSFPTVGWSDGPAAPSSPPRCKYCGHPMVGLSIVTDPVLLARMHSTGCPSGGGGGGPTPSAQAGSPGPSGQTTASAQGGTATPSGQGGVAGTIGANGLPVGGTAGSATGGAGGLPGSAALNLGTNTSINNGPLIMFGDLSPLQGVSSLPGQGGQPGIATRGAAPPSFVRGFKIADNQSPRPVDRAFYSFNFFDNVWQKVNEHAQNGIDRVQIYRQLFGVEKTFWDGQASLGVRLPINTLTASSPIGGVSTPTRTAINNFNIYSKFLFYSDDATKTYASWGVATTIPTGPRNFAGAPYVRNYNNFELQPYVGYQKTWDRWYVLGFEAINVPLNTHDVTNFYSDFAVGYFLHRATDPKAFLQGFAPTTEVHVNIPLNHRDIFNLKDRAGSADIVDFTLGANFFFRGKVQLGTAVVAPVTGPRPFSLEALAILNVYF